MQYGSGGVDLDVFRDVVSLGGVSATVNFGVATAISSGVENMLSEGIMGLGFAGLSQFTSPPYFDTVADTVRSCLFSCTLRCVIVASVFL